MSWPQDLGPINRENIRQWALDHPWGTQAECWKALGLSSMCVSRHVQRIRAEWRPKSLAEQAEDLI